MPWAILLFFVYLVSAFGRKSKGPIHDRGINSLSRLREKFVHPMTDHLLVAKFCVPNELNKSAIKIPENSSDGIYRIAYNNNHHRYEKSLTATPLNMKFNYFQREISMLAIDSTSAIMNGNFLTQTFFFTVLLISKQLAASYFACN